MDGDDEFNLLVAQRASGGDAVPLCEAAAAAGRGRMLRLEDRVAPHRRLASVVLRLRGAAGASRSRTILRECPAIVSQPSRAIKARSDSESRKRDRKRDRASLARSSDQFSKTSIIL